MILISSSLERPVFTSVSMPRSLKMATAAGDNLSEIRTLGMTTSTVLHLREGPIEPGRERFDIGCFHGGAAPDAQALRRRAIAADVEGGVFLLQKGCDLRGGCGLRLLGLHREPGFHVLRTHDGVGSRHLTRGEIA